MSVYRGLLPRATLSATLIPLTMASTDSAEGQSAISSAFTLELPGQSNNLICRACGRGPMGDRHTFSPRCKAPYHNSCGAKETALTYGGYGKCCGSRPGSPINPPVTFSRADLDSLRSACFSDLKSEQKVTIEAIFIDQQQIRERVEDISNKLNTKFAAVDARSDDLLERCSQLEGSVASTRDSADSSATASSALSNSMIVHKLEERQRRSSNLIFLNIPESPEGQQPDDTLIVSTLLGPLSVDTNHLRVRRLGVRSGEPDGARGRLLLAVLGTLTDALRVLKNRRLLRHNGVQVRLRGDETPMQKQQFIDAEKSLEARTKAGEKDLTIKHVRGQPTVIGATQRDGFKVSNNNNTKSKKLLVIVERSCRCTTKTCVDRGRSLWI